MQFQFRMRLSWCTPISTVIGAEFETAGYAARLAAALKIVLDRHAKWRRGEAGGTRADLSGADLSGADLRGADLSGTDLRGASGVIDAGTPNGLRVVGWLLDGWLAVNCSGQNTRLEDARAHATGRDDRRELAAALDYVAAVAAIRGWPVEAKPPRPLRRHLWRGWPRSGVGR